MATKVGLVIAAFIGIIVLAGLLGLLFAIPLMWAINWLFTPALLTLVFGVPKIGILQSVVLSLVTGVLFKSYNTKS